MRLIPVKALDQPTDTEWIKVADTKNCLTFATGVMRGGQGGSSGASTISSQNSLSGSYCLCVAVKRQVIIYEITRLKSRHKRLREVLLPAQAQSLDVFSEGRLCVGYQSGFTIYSLLGDQHPLSLVHPDNQVLGFLAYNPVDAMGAVEMANGEFLLVFNTLGVYVDVQGRKSRDKEIMFPAMPTDVAVSDDGGLLVYSDTHIDVFDTATGDWVQTINIRKTRPLIKTGVLNLSMLQELPHITYLCSYQEDTLNVMKPELMVMGRDGRPVQRTRRRFSVRETNKQIRSNPDRRSKLISAPSNFNHISHMGPGDGIQIQRLMDLPTTLETAEPGERGPSVAVEMRDSRSHSQTKHSSLNQSSSSGLSLASQQINQQGVQRVKSLLQTSAKLPSRLPPGGHSGPIAPQRSVSHNEDMTNTTTSTTVGGLIHEAGRSPRHSLGSNNSSNLSSPPSPHIRDGNVAGNNQ